jgi:hypothetical protein
MVKSLASAGVVLIAAGMLADASAVGGRNDSASGLAGLRKLAAGLSWVGVYGDWHRRDIIEMQRGLNWTVRLDPSVGLYWLDGARMLAYDAAAWRNLGIVDADRVAAIKREQLLKAIAWLEQGREHRPDDVMLPIEQAVLWWSVARDAERAERALGDAAQYADAPYFVARVRAEMLTELGRDAEAREILRAELPRLPSTDPSAMRSVVVERIAELQRRIELGD